MKRKKFKIDLNRKDIPDDIKDLISNQTKIISSLNGDIKTLQAEQKKYLQIIAELKKNLI
jgi:hypothetical protein